MASSGFARLIQAVRHVLLRGRILSKSRYSAKPSSEILQTVPDLFEIYQELHLWRTWPRGLEKRPWTLLSCTMSTCNRCYTPSFTAGISANFSSTTQVIRASARLEPAELFAMNIFEKSPTWTNDDVLGWQALSYQHCLMDVLSKLQDSCESLSRETVEKVEKLADVIQQRRVHDRQIPKTINCLDFVHLLNLQTKRSRSRYLSFLVKKEWMKAGSDDKAAKADQTATSRWKTFKASDMVATNTIVRRGQTDAEIIAHQWNLVRGLLFGAPIIFDMSYDSLMSRGELINTILQLNIVMKINKTLKDPFQIHLANFSPTTPAGTEMRRFHKDHYDNLLINLTDKDPLDLFPAESLVYLSANSPNVLTEYDRRKIYIIGGFVDRRIRSNISLSRSEGMGISHARLPLDEHLRWHKSTKNLTLDQMMQILSELKISGDWKKALQHVPSRKHLGSRG